MELFKRLHVRTSHKSNLKYLNNNERKNLKALETRINKLVDKLNRLEERVFNLSESSHKHGNTRKLANQFYELDAKIDSLLQQMDAITDFAYDRRQAKVA